MCCFCSHNFVLFLLLIIRSSSSHACEIYLIFQCVCVYFMLPKMSSKCPFFIFQIENKEKPYNNVINCWRKERVSERENHSEINKNNDNLGPFFVLSWTISFEMRAKNNIQKGRNTETEYWRTKSDENWISFFWTHFRVQEKSVRQEIKSRWRWRQKKLKQKKKKKKVKLYVINKRRNSNSFFT